MSEEEIISISDSESSQQSSLLLKIPLTLPRQHVCNKPVSENNENKVITISSHSNQSTERCPVTWSNAAAKKAPFKYLDTESFLSPSPRTKVSSWLYGNCQSNTDADVKNTDNKSSILIRQDYRKPELTGSSSPQYSPTYFNSPEKLNVCHDEVICITSRGSSDASEIILNSYSSEKERTLVNKCSSKSTTPTDTKITSNQCTKQTSMFSNTFSVKEEENKFPVDLEVPNKIELCQYLKLMNMNPVDGKVIGSKQNRRSSRVKNLAIMSEKRALERELNTPSCEKKKSVNGADQDVKSCTGSESSKESGGSSKASNGTNLSSTTHKANDKINPPLRKLSDDENNISVLDIPEDSKNNSIRTKSLQVPEVSTTSTSKLKSLTENEQETKQKSSSKKLNSDKDSSPNSERKSVIMTKKSFTQLNININAIKTNKDNEKLQTVRNSLLNYITGIAKMDFEDIFNKCISTDDINKHLQKQNKLSQRSKTPLVKEKPKNKNITRNEGKQKLRVMDKFPKSRLRQLHDKLKIKRVLKTKEIKKEPLKLKKPFMFYSQRRHLTMLRSRGRLREIGIKSVLLNHDRKKKKKRFTVKATQVTSPKQQNKEFRKAVLIQKRADSTPASSNTPEVAKKSDPSLHPVEFSPMKILKLKSEIDLLKNLTPEHRKALFESKKFLIMKSKENAKVDINNVVVNQETEQNKSDNPDNGVKRRIETVEKIDKTTETTQDCDSTFTLPKLMQATQPTRPDSEFSRPTSEDLEVHKLMSSTYLKDQILQQKSKSVEVTSLLKNALDAVLKEKWICSSSSKSTSTSHSSPDTAETDRELLNSPIDDVRFRSRSYQNTINEEIVETTTLTQDHEMMSDDEDETEKEYENQPEVVDISDIERTKVDCIQLVDDQDTPVKSLHQCLTQPRKKPKEQNEADECVQDWDERFQDTGRSPKSERRITQSYAIDLSSSNGAVMNAYYLDYNLVIVQEFLISFWNQTSLGNVLGAQDMWMPKGDTKRIVLGNGCTHKESAESVMVLDNSIAYVELWTKEHKSDKRERPVADIFVTIYLRLKANGPDKKVLQLENIHGYANDVQYIVLKNSPYIVVSWNTVNDQLTSTVVHKYQLSSDYQTVTNIDAFQPAAHYIASLNNIEDSDTLIMGCGEDKITLWHVDDGYIVATMDLMAIAQQPRMLWAKADRGFIFTLHNFNDGYFHLIATNSFDYSWKQLQVYKQEPEYENLLGICIENGLVVAFYDTGILCWSAKSGELLIDGPCENSIFLPFGKHIVVIIENQVHVRHVLEYIVTLDDS